MRFLKIWLPLLVGAILFAVVGVLSDGFRLRNPFQSELVFAYPQIAAERAGGGTYLIDNSFRRIVGVSADGAADIVIEGGRKDPGRFFYANDIVSDTSGNLFVLNYVHDDYGMYLVREEILWYDSSGSLVSIPVQRYYEELDSTRVQRGEIWAIRSDGTWLYWLILTEDGIEAFRKSLDREVLERLGRVSLPDAHISTADIDWFSDSQVVWIDKSGTFLSANLQSGEVSPPIYQTAGYPEEVAWELAVGDSGIAYVNLLGKEIRFIETDSDQSRPILDPHILDRQGYPEDPYYYYRIAASSDGSLLTTNDEGVIVFTPEGQVESYATSAKLSPGQIVLRALLWLGIIVATVLLAAAVVGFYLHIMNRKVSILLKQILVFVPLMIVSMVIITTIITRGFLDRTTAREELTVAGLAQAISRTVDGDLLQTIDSQSDYFSASYQDLRSHLHQSINDNSDPWNRSYYFALYRVFDNVLYGFMYQNDRIGMFYPFSWFDEEQGVYRRAAAGEIATERISDVSGDWLYAVAPVRNAAGSVTGLLEIGTDLYNLRQANQALFDQTMRVMALISAIIIGIIVLMSTIILNSIRILRRGVSQISQGNWDYQVSVKTNDEMSDLGQSFNLMSRSIGQYLQEIKKLNTSYRRFFPEQFLNYLDIPSLTDARLGDQVLKTMTVLFSDIRSFTDISEKMTPKENFDFLNRYLNLVGPLVRKHNGFIDKYMGDAIMALFPNRPDEAIAASIEIHNALGDFNTEQRKLGLPEIKIGVGIHTGPLMLGILGEAERMQGTVISDSVNLAARLETLTKQVGAATLISEDTLTSLGNPDNISTRYLGKIRVKGKQKALRIFEVMEGLPAAVKERKIQSKRQLSALLESFEEGRIEDVKARIAKFPVSPESEPMLKHISLAVASLAAQMPPAGWDGTINFESK